MSAPDRLLGHPVARPVSFEARAVLSWSGRVREVDEALARLLGVTPDHLVGRSFLPFVATEDRASLRTALTRRDASRRWQVRLRTPDGLHEALAIVGPAVDDQDDVVLALLVGEDVVGLRRRAENLARANASKQLVIDTLQAVLVPETQTVPGLAAHVRHAAWDTDTLTSGDAADVLPLDEHRCHVALVDVTGHGVAHTAEALLLLQTLRVLALTDVPVSDLLDVAGPLVAAQHENLTACVVVGRYDDRDGQLQLSGAGAPPVAVCRTDRDIEFVELPGSPLGFGVGAAPRTVELRLAVGDRVLLVSDGVIGQDGQVWPDDLTELCRASTDRPLDELLVGLVPDLAPGQRKDDATVLGLQRIVAGAETSGAPVGGPFTARLSPHTVDIAPARLRLRRWLDRTDLPPRLVDDVVLAMSELVTNAVRAARTQVEVEVHRRDDGVELTVRDDGPGLPPAATTTLRDTRGAPDRTRGLFLVAEVADDVFVATDRSGTLIRVVHVHAGRASL